MVLQMLLLLIQNFIMFDFVFMVPIGIRAQQIFVNQGIDALKVSHAFHCLLVILAINAIAILFLIFVLIWSKKQKDAEAEV